MIPKNAIEIGTIYTETKTFFQPSHPDPNQTRTLPKPELYQNS